MKRSAVETGCVNASHGRNGAQASAARRQERIVACQRLDMIFRWSGQRRTDLFLIPGVGLMPVVGGAPQEHRDLNRSEAGAVKGEAERGRGGCNGADAPIRLPFIRRWLGRLLRRRAAEGRAEVISIPAYADRVALIVGRRVR